MMIVQRLLEMSFVMTIVFFPVETIATEEGKVAKSATAQVEEKEVVPLLEFAIESLTPNAMSNSISAMGPMYSVFSRGVKLGMSGRIVPGEEGRYFLLTTYAPLWAGFETPGRLQQDAFVGMWYLTPCSMTRFSISKGYQGWLIRGPKSTPDRRYPNALELELINPVKAGIVQEKKELVITGLNSEFQNVCRKIMADWKH